MRLALLLIPLVAACPLGPRPCFDDDQCEDGDVCVGAADAPGQCLGPDDPAPDGGPGRVRVDAESVEVGGAFACGLSTDGDVFCMGGGSNGQLGVAEVANPNTFNSPIVIAADAIDVAVADDHGCAIFDDGGERSVRCWGSSTGGRLGVPAGVEAGTFVEPILPAGVADDALEIDGGQAAICLRTTNEVWCWGPGIPNYTPGDAQRIDAFNGATSLELNEATVCAIVAAEVLCLDALAGVDCSGDPSRCAVEIKFDASAQLTCESNGSQVRCAGDNDYGVVNPNEPGTEFAGLQVVTQGDRPQVGTQVACALSQTSEVVCWGRNLFASTGQTELFGDPCLEGLARCQVPTAVPETTDTRQFDLRRLSGCAVLDDGDVTCWGEFLSQQPLAPQRFSVFR